jgi:glycosyltransferase involved in cell wall biosynthesis
MKKVLLITRPICPPWDEASKNFAYFLSKNIDSVEFGLLTNGIIPDMPSNVRQKVIYTSNDFSYFQKLRLIRNLRKIKNDYDILHYIFTPTKQNSFLLKHFVNYKKRKETKTIQTIATLREDLYKEKEIKDLLFGDLIITYSDYAKDKLNKLGFNNVKRVYPGIDLDLYSPASKDEELRKNLNLTKNDFVISYSGEYTRLGATDDFVNMVIKYQSELFRKNIKLIFACRIKNDKDARKRNSIIKSFSKKKLLELVRFPKTFNSMEKMYNLSDICLFPVQNMKGKFDIPLVIPEAMACGKPVVLSDLPILAELSNGQNSVIISRGDIDALAQSIFDLHDNPEKRKKIGIGARKFVENRFDIKKIAEIYEKIYEKL